MLRKKEHCRWRSAANVTVTAASSALQEVNHQVGPHDMGRTDVRAAAGGLQHVPRKCVESAMQKLSLRFCGILRLLQQSYQRHETRTCFLNKRATHFFSKPEARSTNQSTQSSGRILVKHVTVWNAKAHRCFSDSEVDNRVADIGTPTARSSAMQFHGRHPFHVKSSDRAVACNVVIDVISTSSFCEHPSLRSV